MEIAPEATFLSILLPLIIVIFIIAIGVFLLNQHFQRNLFKQIIQQEELKSQYQKELLKSSIQVQELERKRISRDLHDELGAKLSIARMLLLRLEEISEPADPAIKSSLLHIRNIAESALASVREISHKLMPPQLEVFGLLKTLESLADQINLAGKLTVCLNADSLSRLPWEIEVAVYRIIMELLQNTMKHSNAKNVVLNIKKTENEIEVVYLDDGKGIGPTKSAGLGLQNIEARTNALGGVLEVTKGNNFKAVISIPHKSEIIDD
jgi:signal transduction histidine kinase